MEDKFLIVGMTPPNLSKDESERITMMLQSGIVDYMHIRHPEAPRKVIEAVIEGIPAHLHRQLRIHSCFELLDKYDLAGAHLNSRWPSCNLRSAKSLTKSCHRLYELWTVRSSLDYVTLSPVYSSMSKPGNLGDFNRNSLMRSIRNKKVIALGGVAPDKFAELKQAGFYGAGMLGYLWQEEYMRSLRQIKMFRNDGFYLQYITNSDTPEGVIAEARKVLEGGCKWIQIRMKGADDATVEKAVNGVLPMCHANNAILLIDDRVDLAARLDVDGVHIGKQDMMPKDARQVLGELKIIGCSANSFNDISEIDRYGVADYVGLGPLRDTPKKKFDHPIGYEGILEIFERMHERQIDIPVAINGGVRAEDVTRLMEMGASGVGVSTAIYDADDPTVMTELFVEKTYER